mgnify:CR=1 FL=1
MIVSTDITGTSAWQKLRAHYADIEGVHLRELFQDDPARGRELTIDAGDLHIDYSKHRVSRETLTLLVDLAREAGLSRYQLVRQFAQATGLTPHAYLVQRRLHHARRLMRAGTPLAEVERTMGRPTLVEPLPGGGQRLL